MADEPWSESSARTRLARLAPRLPVRLEREPRFLPSYSNDAWDLGESVLRVCWRGARERLLREAALGAALPPAVGYPEVLGHGSFEDMTWMITRRVSGVPLDQVWGGPDLGAVRAAMADYATRLKVLHAWTPPPGVAERLREHADARPRGVDAVIGLDVLPLPLERSATLVPAAKALAFVDAGVVEAAWSRMGELAPVDPLIEPGARVAHGDATYPNILIAGERVAALLDFEWARLGPPVLELVAWTRLLEDLRDEGASIPPVLDWLQADYPALFAPPDLSERLWLCELAYTLRHLVFWPPDTAEDRLQRDHPLHRLRRLVERPIAWE